MKIYNSLRKIECVYSYILWGSIFILSHSFNIANNQLTNICASIILSSLNACNGLTSLIHRLVLLYMTFILLFDIECVCFYILCDFIFILPHSFICSINQVHL